MRTLAALLLTGLLAPLIFAMLNLLWAVIQTHGTIFLSPPHPKNEIVGLTLITLVLGAPASIGAALVGGLPGIYLARRLRLTSLWIFGVGGAILALCCTVWFAREDVRGYAEWIPFAALATLTGAICGMVGWAIAERPRLKRDVEHRKSAHRPSARSGEP